jgi:hypothetical protein
MLFRVVYGVVIGQKHLFNAYGHPSLKNGVPGADHRLVSIIDRHAEKTQKRLNEPNSKNANPPLNIDDFTHFDFFKK